MYMSFGESDFNTRIHKLEIRVISQLEVKSVTCSTFSCYKQFRFESIK